MTALSESRKKARRLRWNKINKSQLEFWLPQGGVKKVASKYGATEYEVAQKIREFGIKWEAPGPPKPPKKEPKSVCLKPTVKHKTGHRSAPKDDAEWQGMNSQELRQLILDVGLSAVAYRENVSIGSLRFAMKRLGVDYRIIRASTEELIAELNRRNHVLKA